ncbi:hypothetical protein [Pseudoduganella armeniaca]|uniref:Uncharacterized protein n=1 Tax=Pseudoduganella armeniaca TaxID=2072590 RepID=A0A2R4C418_9BURK|nr:hypothetical protein [Pseudoduganella armeniaca]AVR94278.1 hypothetical protein C9I28_00055 [Pseudoduganella armeniaca]
MQTDSSSGAVIFPFLRFVVAHLFESIALAIALIGTFAYALGMAFYDGWSEMAGIPVSYFQYSTYEIVRKGIGVPEPWLYTAFFSVFVLAYIFFINAWETWSRQRKITKGRMDTAQAAKTERRSAAFTQRHKLPSNSQWRALGRRGTMAVTPLKAKTAKQLRRRALVLDLVRAFMPVFFFCACVLIYKAFFTFAVSPAVIEGRKSYLQLYIAVAGKLPPNLTQLRPSNDYFLELGCLGVSKLKNYIAIDIPSNIKQEPRSGYIIEASGNNFVLLTTNGIKIKSYGDSGYELAESPNRPLAPMMKSCSSNAS